MKKKRPKGVSATIATIVSRENVCLCPPSTKCSTDILLRDIERITFKAIHLKILRGVQKMEKRQKWYFGNNGFHCIHKECPFVSPSHPNALRTYWQGVAKV